MSSDRHFLNDEGPLHKVVKEDDKLFHVPVVPKSLSKYILHQVHNVLGHNGTARTYQYLKNCIIGKDYQKS